MGVNYSPEQVVWLPPAGKGQESDVEVDVPLFRPGEGDALGDRFCKRQVDHFPIAFDGPRDLFQRSVRAIFTTSRARSCPRCLHASRGSLTPFGERQNRFPPHPSAQIARPPGRPQSGFESSRGRRIIVTELLAPDPRRLALLEGRLFSLPRGAGDKGILKVLRERFVTAQIDLAHSLVAVY
jgi:hypothetical protein